MQFHFSGHVLDVDLRELTRGGENIAVEPQVFDLLTYLVENRDRVVSKDDLLASVWGKRAISESALFNRINGIWEGRNQSRIRHSSKTIFAWDGYESVTDGNGDVFFNCSQWATPDRTYEYLRHNKRANVLFVDTHVERLTRTDLMEERLYTGRW